MGFELMSEPDWARLIEGAGDMDPLHVGLSVDRVARSMGGRLAYLATPYSREVLTGGVFDPIKGEGMAYEAARWVAVLARAGVTCAAPIVTAQAAVSASDGMLDPLAADFWMAWCLPMLRKADAVIVPPISGWWQSRGVWAEARFALSCRKPVLLIDGGAGFPAARGVMAADVVGGV